MASESREQFLAAMTLIKKASICFPSTVSLQLSEIAVMYRASERCDASKAGFTVSEIQRSLHISKPAVSQILNNLEKNGFIVRSIDSGDRRKITVTLTEDGKSELKHAVRCQDEALEQVFERFGEDNVRMFIKLVNRLVDILEEINNEENGRCE